MNFKFKSDEAKALYNKALEIFEIVDTIVDLIPDDDTHNTKFGQLMQESAMCILPKIVAAESGKLYDIRMECAALIRMYGNDINKTVIMLNALDCPFKEYLRLVSSALDEFRRLFRKWLATFDTKLAIEDEWGLFNPVGFDPNTIDEYYLLNALEEEDDDIFGEDIDLFDSTEGG